LNFHVIAPPVAAPAVIGPPVTGVAIPVTVPGANATVPLLTNVSIAVAIAVAKAFAMAFAFSVPSAEGMFAVNAASNAVCSAIVANAISTILL
jgi:hypothetical protein